jgi:hypothetical protein
MIRTFLGAPNFIRNEVGEEPSGSLTLASKNCCAILLLEVQINLSDPATMASPYCDSDVLPVKKK